MIVLQKCMALLGVVILLYNGSVFARWDSASTFACGAAVATTIVWTVLFVMYYGNLPKRDTW